MAVATATMELFPISFSQISGFLTDSIEIETLNRESWETRPMI